jgi:uncharacterized membrane protein YhaH (DUF805 family)
VDWQWLLFSFEGRINRAKFLIAVLITFCWQMFLVISWATIGVIFELPTSQLAEAILPIPFSFEFINDDPPWKAAVFTLLATIPINISFAWVVAATLVKRLHDRDKSGWWAALLYGVPYLYLTYIRLCYHLDISVGAPTLLAVLAVPVYVLALWGLIELYFLMGTDGRNRFGRDPLATATTSAPTDSHPDQGSVPGFLVHNGGPHAGRNGQ